MVLFSHSKHVRRRIKSITWSCDCFWNALNGVIHLVTSVTTQVRGENPGNILASQQSAVPPSQFVNTE